MKLTIKRIIKFTIALVLIIISLLVIQYIAVPISRPYGSIRNYVLKVIPVGTSWDVCQQISNDKGWKVEQTSDRGLNVNVNYEDREAHIASEEDIRDGVKFPYRQILGDKSMLIYLGRYHNPLITDVYAYLAFDKNGELVDAFIRKDIDAP